MGESKSNRAAPLTRPTCLLGQSYRNDVSTTQHSGYRSKNFSRQSVRRLTRMLCRQVSRIPMLGFQPGQFISSLNITYQVSSVHNFHRCCAMHAGSIAFELPCDDNYI